MNFSKNVITTGINNNLAESSEEIFLESLFGKSAKTVDGLFTLIRNKPKGDSLDVIDYDDTLYSRSNTLEIEGLKNNRALDGNIWIIAAYSNIISKENSAPITNAIRGEVERLSEKQINKAYKKFIKEYYSETGDGERRLGLIENINQIINEYSNRSHVILTAGESCLQNYKVEETGLSHLPLKVVEKSDQKNRAIFEHILELGYIPEEIIIYEDRPEFFYQYGQIMSNILGTSISIMQTQINKSNQVNTMRGKKFLPK